MRRRNINSFKRIKVKLDMDTIVERAAEDAQLMLEYKHTIFKRHRRTGNNYSKTWDIDYIKESDNAYAAYVWNRKNWQLTWLLENGHLIVNKNGGVGWAAPKKHIRPTFDKVSKDFVENAKDVKIEILLE